jgi:hypothetical protein
VGLVAVVRMDNRMDWWLSNHFLPQALSFALKLFYLESLEDLSICMLGLAIAPGIGDGGKADLDAGRCIVLSE